MTTLAYRDGILAADTVLMPSGWSVQKVYRLPDGGVVGGCGLWRAVYAGIQWLVSGEQGDPPDMEDASLLIVRPDGVVWAVQNAFPAFPLMDTMVTMGCGGDAALAAMKMGKTAPEAVALATAVDTQTRAPVQSIMVQQVDAFEPVKTHAKRRR